MADCFFHSGRPAVIRCKQCGKPLCSECRKITADGIFCSDECAQRYGVFAERAENLEEQRRSMRPSRTVGVIKVIIVLAVLYGIYLAVMKFLV